MIPTELDEDLLNALIRYKLKIMTDYDGGTKWVQCVIRTDVISRKILSSIEARYSGDPEHVNARSMVEATNMCMQDLVNKIQLMKDSKYDNGDIK